MTTPKYSNIEVGNLEKTSLVGEHASQGGVAVLSVWRLAKPLIGLVLVITLGACFRSIANVHGPMQTTSAHGKDLESEKFLTLYRHCIAANGDECWDSLLPAVRLRVMCGLSGGNGYPVNRHSCNKMGYTCDVDVPATPLFVGMGFHEKPGSDGVCRPQLKGTLPCCTEGILSDAKAPDGGHKVDEIACECNCSDHSQIACTGAGKAFAK